MDYEVYVAELSNDIGSSLVADVFAAKHGDTFTIMGRVNDFHQCFSGKIAQFGGIVRPASHVPFEVRRWW